MMTLLVNQIFIVSEVEFTTFLYCLLLHSLWFEGKVRHSYLCYRHMNNGLVKDKVRRRIMQGYEIITKLQLKQLMQFRLNQP